jgi:hypothetical protein
LCVATTEILGIGRYRCYHRRAVRKRYARGWQSVQYQQELRALKSRTEWPAFDITMSSSENEAIWGILEIPR